MLAQIVWQAPGLLPLAIVIAAGTCAGVLLLYTPQARRVRQPWRWGLPILRLCVGGALAASVLQPVIVRSESDKDRGAVLVLVDGSRSMSVVDSRSPAELVAIADALRMLPAGARPRVGEGLAAELDAAIKLADDLRGAREDVEYAKLAGQGVIAAQSRYDDLARRASSAAAKLVRLGQAMPGPSDLGAKLAALELPTGGAASLGEYRARAAAARAALHAAQAAADADLYARPDVKTACDAVAAMTRSQLASRAADLREGSVMVSLPAGATYGFTFDNALHPVPPAIGAPAATQSVSAVASGERSDIAGAVRAAMGRMKGRLVQAVVVLSDGRQVGGDDAGVSSTLAPGGVPVYAVSVAASNVRDVSIGSVLLPSRQFTGETTTARVRLRATGMKGTTAEVRLDSAGQSVARPVAFTDDPETVVELPLRFDAAGTQPLTFAVTPLPGEATVANNTLRRYVTVTDDRAPVALVGAHGSWGYQSLRAALGRAPWASVDAEVLDAPGARWSADPSNLMRFGAVIVSDVAVDHLLPRQWDALYRFVADRGGSLIVVAGTNTTSPQLIDSPLLTDLLPFRAGARPAWRSWPGDQPLFRFAPAAAARDAGALRLAEEPSASLERWLELPATFRYLPVTELKPNTSPLLVERESGTPVLTESRLGIGRVFFLGADETWRWRRGPGAADHDRFWLQLIRSAVDDPYAARRGRVSLDADAVSIQPGQPLRVRARLTTPDGLPLEDAEQELRIERGGVEVTSIPLEPDDIPGRYVATLNTLTRGSYDLKVADPYDASAVTSLSVHVAADTDAEMRDVSGDERMLRRLADSTGGQFVPLGDLGSLGRRMQEARQTTAQVAEQSLWDSPYLFGFVLGCLGIEWAMRKRLGLA